MAFHSVSFTYSFPAAADLSASQWKFVKLDANGNAALCTAVTDTPVGVLMNKPTITHAATVMLWGISEVIAGATLAAGTEISVSATSTAVAAGSDLSGGAASVGRMIKSAVTGDYAPAIIWPSRSGSGGGNAQLSLLAAADYSTNQYHLVTLNSSGAWVLSNTTTKPVAVLQNAPTAGAAGVAQYSGWTTVKAGAGGITAGQLVASDATGLGILATAGKHVIGQAKTTALANANFIMLISTGLVET